MSRLNVSNLFNENEDGAPVVSGISTFSSPYYFVPPSGSTAQRPQDPGEGMIRFNTDSGHLEYYAQGYWASVIVNNNELGGSLTGAATTFSTHGTGTRALFFAGATPVNQDVIQYLSISTLGDSQDFGDCSATAKQGNTALSSSVRAVSGGGYAPAVTNEMEFVTVASTGNSTDFGNLSLGRAQLASLASTTRGIFAGGYTNTPTATNLNTIDYITIASTGGAVDFGDVSYGARNNTQACASSVRGIVSGGAPNISAIDYLTISTTGNSQTFGDLSVGRGAAGGCSNSTRGLFAGGMDPSMIANGPTDFITIATTGNAQDFGDITARGYLAAASSSTRAVFAGGLQPGPSVVDIIESMEILSTGNAVDFGNLLEVVNTFGGCSNGHGGL
jgi:hypothetical protein